MRTRWFLVTDLTAAFISASVSGLPGLIGRFRFVVLDDADGKSACRVASFSSRSDSYRVAADDAGPLEAM